jgi:hypothetical protein
MIVTIEVETWGQAHHLASKLADAEWRFRQLDLPGYADFFKQTAKAITQQAEPLNEAEWLARKARGCETTTSTA